MHPRPPKALREKLLYSALFQMTKLVMTHEGNLWAISNGRNYANSYSIPMEQSSVRGHQIFSTRPAWGRSSASVVKIFLKDRY